MSDRVWWEGLFNPDLHTSTGERAWCRCGEWCYEHGPCNCCTKAALGDQTAAEVLQERDLLLTQVRKAREIAQKYAKGGIAYAERLGAL